MIVNAELAKNLCTKNIDISLEKIYNLIKEEAKKGNSSIFFGLNEINMKQRIRLGNLGYKVSICRNYKKGVLVSWY